MATTKINWQAVQEYTRRLAEVQKQIDRIQGALVTDVNDGMWRGEALNYGHCGDLAQLVEDLRSAADFITGETEE